MAGRLDCSETIIVNIHPVGLKKTTSSIRTGWKAKYHDVMLSAPKENTRCDLSQSFQVLIEKANEWLRKNVEVKVKSCETITWSSRDAKKLGDSEEMVLTRGILENDCTHYMRGLRLWLVPQTSNKQEVLSCTDIVPERGDDIQQLVNKVNEKINKNQLKGEIITIETIASPVLENNRVQTSQTRWTDGVNEEKHYAFSLRIFYIKGPHPCNTRIGICDKVPQRLPDGYEGFSDLCQRANDWLKEEENIKITNLQSLMVLKDDVPHDEMGSRSFYTIRGIHNQDDDDDLTTSESFRILRIAFLRVPSNQPSTVIPFTYDTFTPELVASNSELKPKEKMEKMKHTFSRMAAFLRNTPSSEIINIETVTNPMIFSEPEQQYQTDDAHDVDDEDEMKLLLTLRVYLSRQMEELNGSRELIPLTGRRKKSRDEPAGPIFLGHVVSRQYKYRWVVLAVTVFICMTIIVALSVIYSNQ